MLVQGPLRWMLPVAVMAMALPAAWAVPVDADALAARLEGLKQTAADALPAPEPPAAPSAAETLAALREWQARQALGGDPTPSEPEAPQEKPESPEGAGAPTEETPPALLQEASGQATERAQALAEKAGATARLLPADPVALAASAAQKAAGQATRTLPLIQEPAAPAPAGGAHVAREGGFPPLLTGSILVASAAGATFLAFWLAGSSGTVATGAAAAKGSEMRRLLPFASPLFTRFEKETVLGHPRREALYALILQQPGISLQALGEAAGLSRTAVLHHLRLLEMQHLVVSKRMGRSRHYYENGGRYGRDAKDAYAVLQNPRSREVAEFIRTHPGAMQKQLCASLGIQPSIAHWHVRRLQAARLVEAVRHGRVVNYFAGPGLLEVAAQPPLPAAPQQQPAPLAPLARHASIA